MYAIAWTRLTGEHGICSPRYSNKVAAEKTIKAVMKIEKAKKQGCVYEYKVIEI